VVSDIELLYLGLQHGLVEPVRQWLKPAVRPQRSSRGLDARRGNLPRFARATLPCSGSVKGAILDPDRAADMWEGKVIASARRVLAASLAALTVLVTEPSKAAEPGVVEVAVFDFALDDRSAGGGIVQQDPIDTENLKASTEEARRMLSASGRYSAVDTSSAADEVIAAGGIQHCNGCEVPLAKELGADQSMVGVFTRVSRTEYTLQILVRDTQTGAVVANASTGLRMGANYSWPRGVKWLMNRMLPAQPAQ